MATENYAYPFDPTGTAATNKIVNERQTISPPDWSDFYFVVPLAAPFFKESMRVIHHPSGRILVDGVDYSCTHRFHDASLAVGKPVYGSITFFGRDLTGVVQLDYQTLGGAWTLDAQKIVEILSEKTLNPRITTWESIVELPFEFPVIDHEWDLVDLVGASELVAKLDEIKDAILLSGEGGLGNHLADHGNPHQVTKSQVGLGLVQNYGIASVADATTGTSNSVYMTPLRTAQAITQMAVAPLNNHLSNYNNPHQVTKAQVGLTSVQDYGIATQAEAEAGTATNKYMTPVRVANAITVQAVAPLNVHTARTDNPHNVTKSQVGLGNVQNYAVADNTAAVAGTATNLYMTPALTKAAIDALVGSDINNHINNTNNPHGTTAAQVGLSLVQNYGVATQADAEAGTATNLYMTPLRVKQAVTAIIGNQLTNHINNTSNPHMVTKAQVGLGNVENYPVATTAQAQAGTANNVYMTPARVAEAIAALSDPDGQQQSIAAHVADTSNPHQVTKAQVGLGNVVNYGVADTASAQAGTVDNLYMTPLKTAQAITALVRIAFDEHVINDDNPHNVTKAQVGLGSVENYAIATTTDAQTGTATDKYMTPALTAAAITTQALTPLSSHTSNLNNPHNVTKAQIGLGNVQNYGIATQAQAEAGTATNVYMTPQRVLQAIQANADTNVAAHVADTDNPHQVTAEQVGAYTKEEVVGMVSGWGEPGDMSFGQSPLQPDNQSSGMLVEFINILEAGEDPAEVNTLENPIAQAIADWYRTSQFADVARNANIQDLVAWETTAAAEQVMFNGSGATMASLLSDQRYLNYSFSVEMSSTDTNDGAMGVCAAFIRKDGVDHGIYVLRTPGGLALRSPSEELPGGDIYKLVSVGYNLLQDTAIDYGSTSEGVEWGDGDLHTSGPAYDPIASGGWQGAGACRVTVTRAGNIITIDVSQFADTNMANGIQIVLDLTTLGPEAAVFVDTPTSYGVVGYDQPASLFTFLNRPDKLQPYIVHSTNASGTDTSAINRHNGISWATSPMGLGNYFVKPGRLYFSDYQGRLYICRRNGTLRQMSIDATILTA